MRASNHNRPNNPLIFPPAYDIRPHLQENMGLADKPEMFADFTDMLTSLAPTMLDIGKTYSDQPKKKWDAFVQKACELRPFLQCYVDAWPVKAFMQPKLIHERNQHKANPTCHPARNPRNKTPNPPSCKRNQHLSVRRRRALEKARMSEVIVIDDDQPTVSNPKPDSFALRDFLRSLHLKFDADELLLSLRRSGVNSVEQLTDTLTWSEEQQKIFFMLDVRMTCFEYRSMVQRLRVKLHASH